MSKLSLSELRTRCSPAAQRILGKLPPDLLGKLHSSIPDIANNLQVLFLECELSRTSLLWRQYAPEERSFRVRI